MFIFIDELNAVTCITEPSRHGDDSLKCNCISIHVRHVRNFILTSFNQIAVENLLDALYTYWISLAFNNVSGQAWLNLEVAVGVIQYTHYFCQLLSSFRPVVVLPVVVKAG